MIYPCYNFDLRVDRHNTNCCKWDDDTRRNLLPMWVADMDFRTAPEIIEALHERVDHGLFGYTHVPDEYYEAIVNWFRRRHNWEINPESIIYTSGVVPALSAIVKALTRPGDKVIVQTPVYNCFFSSIRNNGCEVLENPLIYHPDERTYTIDFDQLEEAASDPRATVMIICNPANPAGRVWTPDELRRMGEICLSHGVTPVSDEIHCELVYKPHVYTPFASLSEEFAKASVSCISPTKAFNIAGLQIANIVADDPEKRALIDRAININEVCDVNPFGVVALITAYNECELWLNALLDYLRDNYQYMCDFCREFLPEYPLVRLEGTYLVWMDTRASGLDTATLDRRLLDEASLRLNPGTMYGSEGEGFMRWNIACPRVVLTEGLTRFAALARTLRH